MKRLVLVLGLVVLAWLGRRQLRSAAHAQRYLTLLALLQIIAVMGKTSASPKAVSVENRLNSVVLPALGTINTSLTPLAPLASNAAFLATLRGASDPIGAGTLGLTFTGPGSPTTVAQLNTYLNGGVATLMNSLISYTAALGTCVNSIINEGGVAGIWP